MHLGHLAIIRALLALPGTQQVLVIPARRSPFKNGDTLLPEALRWAMLEQSLAGIQGVTLLDLELRRPPPSYTHETLRALREATPGAHFKLALGWDAYRDFSGWRNAERIIAETPLVVFGRGGMAFPQSENAATLVEHLPQSIQSRVRVKPGSAMDDKVVSILEDETGREVLRLLSLELPDISASGILRDKLLAHVPQAARALLIEFWNTRTRG